MKRPSSAQLVDTKRKKPYHNSTTKRSSKGLDLKDSKSVRDEAEPYRLATVKFPIDALSPIWSVGTNRPINEPHKRKLCGLFKDQGLRRIDVGNRLRVACSREDFEKMKEAIGLAGVEDDVSLPFEDIQTKEPAWPYFKDWMQVVGKEAELMAGNHRVEALKEMLKSGGRIDERWWLCDLYDKDTLPNRLHIRLRANREDVTLPDSHGQIWAEVATLASTDDTLFKGNYKEVECDMVEILGLAGKTKFPARRLVTLWRNKSWKKMITSWCSFSIGLATFNISAFEWMASCRLDDFWFFFFNKAINSATRVRQSYGIEIEPLDWIKLASLSQKSSNRDVTALFYPELGGDAYVETPEFRRRDFLTVLNDEKYKDLYSHMLTESDLRFPDVHSLIRTTRQEGKIMSTIVAHVGHWLNKNPTVIQERNASKPLLRMEFLPALEKKYGNDANKKSIELERQLLVYVKEQMGALMDKTAECFLAQFPTSTEQDYIRRFDHSTWKNILIIVHAMVGPHFQNEAVARFNNEDPNTIRSKPLNTIIHGICDFIGRNPEVSQSLVLSKKSAIEMLHTKLGPIVAEWAVKEYDEALKVCSDDWQPAELAQVKAERTKYAVLWDAEMESADGATSCGNSIDSSVGRSAMAATAKALHDSLQQGDSTDVTENYDVDGDRQQIAVLEGGDYFSGRARAFERTKRGHRHRHLVAEVDTQPKEPSRAVQSMPKSWRGRPVAQASLLN